MTTLTGQALIWMTVDGEALIGMTAADDVTEAGVNVADLCDDVCEYQSSGQAIDSSRVS